MVILPAAGRQITKVTVTRYSGLVGSWDCSTAETLLFTLHPYTPPLARRSLSPSPTLCMADWMFLFPWQISFIAGVGVGRMAARHALYRMVWAVHNFFKLRMCFCAGYKPVWVICICEYVHENTKCVYLLYAIANTVAVFNIMLRI